MRKDQEDSAEVAFLEQVLDSQLEFVVFEELEKEA